MSFRLFRLAPIALAAGFVVGAIGTAQAADVKVKLSGDQEVPAVASTVTGAGTIVIKDDIMLTKSAENTWSVPQAAKLTDEQYKAFKEGNLYVNVHSAEHKSGEIRTQLKP